MVEKANKTPVRKRNITVPEADAPRGTVATQATTPTVATQTVGNEQGYKQTDPSALYEPAPTPVTNQGLTELSAQTRMQGGMMPAGPGGNAPGTGAGGAQPNSAGAGATDKQTPVITATNTGEAGAGGLQGNASQNTTGTGAGEHTDTFNQMKADFEKDPNGVLEKLGVRAEVDPEAKANLAKEEASKASKEKYGADWTKGFTKDALRNSKLSIGEAMAQYENYRREHPDAPGLNMYDFYSLSGHDPNKTLKENEDEKKKEENDRKWEDIQNALFTFADLYHGVKWAPQPTSVETAEQLTKRQEARRDRVKALRDNDWRALQAMWKQQQANEVAKANANAKAKAQAATDAYRQAKLLIEQGKAKQGEQAAQDKHEQVQGKIDNDRRLTDSKIATNEMNAQSNRIRANKSGGGRGGSGRPIYETDTSTTVTTDAATGAKTTKKEEHKYVAGSRNKKQVKTPPSRRK